LSTPPFHVPMRYIKIAGSRSEQVGLVHCFWQQGWCVRITFQVVCEKWTWCPISVHAQKAENAACFWVCTLSPFGRTECRGIFPRKSAKYFSSPQSETRSKMSKKIACGAKIYSWFTIKNLHDAHQFFDQSTVEMVTHVFLSVECTKYVQTMQNQFLISLFLRGK